MKKIKCLCFPAVFLIAMMAVAMLGGCSGGNRDVPAAKEIKFGTLPLIHALPLFAAQEQGFFTVAGMKVELISFNSAMEKDVAMSARQLSGYFGDIMTPMVLRSNNVPVKMVATIFNTTGSRRMFALLAAPNRPAESLSQLAKEGIAIGSNTIVEYLAVKMLEKQGVSPQQTRWIEAKNIPIRLQMLMESQAPAAVLPEPLVTFAERKGARILVDDAGMGISDTVLVFTDDFLKQHPEQVRAFLKAVSKGADYLNNHPEEARLIANKHCRIPEELAKTLTLPSYPTLSLPNRSQLADIYGWLRKKGIISQDMAINEMVADGFLP
ncbi:MAG TPA: ABC transporter substrate-binding protein [Syntrophales bacterium]